jgi:hypothetical protein
MPIFSCSGTAWGDELGSFSRDFALGETESGAVRWKQLRNGEPEMSTTAVLDAKIATAVVNLAIGVAIGTLIGGVATRSVPGARIR